MLVRQPTKERVDQISEVLGDVRYMTPYYPPGLTEHILGPYARDKVPVSRHYLFVSPSVMVDFEPAPSQGRFYVEEKRAFFSKQGQLYVPIFLRERLSREQFKERVREELRLLRMAQREARKPISPTEIEAAMATPEMQLRIDDELARRHPARPLYGVGKASWLKRTRAEIAAQLREQVIRDGLADV